MAALFGSRGCLIASPISTLANFAVGFYGSRDEAREVPTLCRIANVLSIFAFGSGNRGTISLFPERVLRWQHGERPRRSE